MSPEPTSTAQARKLLESDGYVVVKAKSYRAMQERQRVAEALRDYAVEQARSAEAWGSFGVRGRTAQS